MNLLVNIDNSEKDQLISNINLKTSMNIDRQANDFSHHSCIRN